ncbi:MAG: c-type cytochrome biogenesis protein CcsB [Desulfomonile tiedjei]|uniref:C-type cytochrome biogenesis protein CcsB n=1 Tax=Desulfomonile tiedjei TaxID=2358 RepID=A0A9D6V322_9BACT|nr:c-type cytochrome biogenesis protein CcsB [Desulfomonile tiedjei]
MDLIFFKISIVLYLGAAVGYLLFLLVSTGNRAELGFWSALAGFLCHSLSILHRAIFSGFFPLATPFDVLSFFAWVVVGLFLLMRYRDPSPIFGSVAVPMALVLMLFGSTLSYQIKAPIVPVLKSWWLPIHVILAVAGNGVFALMAIGGLMYVVQERLIKTKRIGRMHRLLPSLETLDMINRRGLTLGFFLLTLGIISGALWAGSIWGFYWSWDPKETWSLITWFAYAAMVHQRVALGWRGRRAALLAMMGFALVIFTFVGVSLLLGGHHSFTGSTYSIGTRGT